MAIKPASLSSINSVSLGLLRSIESENALPAGAFSDFQAGWESPRALDLNQLQACIFATVDLLKHRLLEAAATVYRHHNSLLPIQRLPPEVLSTTISHALAEIDSHNHQKRLIQLSTVSLWWRNVTLGTPSLWGVIHSKDPDWIVSLALDRSKDTPLTVLWERESYSSTLYGSESYRSSIEPDDFFGLVSPHTARWCDVTLSELEYGNDSIGWLDQHKLVSSRLRQLNLCGNGPPSTEKPITGFSGLAEQLLELKLQNLHVSSVEIFRILSTSTRMTSLDLESLVVVEREDEARPENERIEKSLATIDLPRLTKLNLKWLPPSILGPIVQGINVSILEKVTIAHDMVAEDPAKPQDPFASFIARLVATEHWVELHPQSTKVILKPFSHATFQYTVELRGRLPAILPWLRLRSLPQITSQHHVDLIFSNDLEGDPDPVVIENLMHFPKVGYAQLSGYREAWRWIWLLSLPDAVQTDSVNLDTPIKSRLWPDLEYLYIDGDTINEFTVLSFLLARYRSQATRGSTTQEKNLSRKLTRLFVRPESHVWRAEVVDQIRGLVGPGCFHWVKS